MTTLLAPNGITSLQRDLSIAVAAQVIDRGSLDGDTGLEGVAARLRNHGRDLICFSGHACGVSRFVRLGCGKLDLFIKEQHEGGGVRQNKCGAPDLEVYILTRNSSIPAFPPTSIVYFVKTISE